MQRFITACILYAALASALTLATGQAWSVVAVSTTIGSTLMVAVLAAVMLGERSAASRVPSVPPPPPPTPLSNERLLNAEVVELKRQLELQEQSLANVSHELRTPLTSIIGYCELLTNEVAPQLNEKQRGNLANIQRNANILLSLVNNMLDLSRMSAGQMEMTWTRVHLEEVLEVAVDVVESQIQLKGLELVVDLPDSPLVVQGSFDRLRQVFVNLLSNAAKFTEKGSITIAARAIDGAVEVRVSDTGIGIPSEQVGHVFEKFRQADSSIRRRFGGSGLGLALCHSIVKLHNGDITVESKPGQGTTMIVHLPAAIALKARPANPQ
jgi:signal transduction histidine kinase